MLGLIITVTVMFQLALKYGSCPGQSTALLRTKPAMQFHVMKLQQRQQHHKPVNTDRFPHCLTHLGNLLQLLGFV